MEEDGVERRELLTSPHPARGRPGEPVQHSAAIALLFR